jgi:hypothetical protein
MKKIIAGLVILTLYGCSDQKAPEAAKAPDTVIIEKAAVGDAHAKKHNSAAVSHQKKDALDKTNDALDQANKTADKTGQTLDKAAELKQKAGNILNR